MDAVSVQSFLDELIDAYGKIDPKLSSDLTQSKITDRFRLLVRLTGKLAPNNRQFAMAQYCTGKMNKQQKQLWNVPWGKGKSRISATIAAIALLTGVVDVIYIVHESKYLMKRDQKDFQPYWQLLEIEGTASVKYQAGLDFIPEPNSLVIFDEADEFMFGSPARFTELIDGCFCICLTATPDNCDPEGAHSLLLKTLQFGRYNYVLDVPANKATKLEIDAVVDASSVEQKVSFAVQQLSNGPVLAFCDQALAEQLAAAAGDLVVNMNEDTDYNLLRTLD